MCNKKLRFLCFRSDLLVVNLSHVLDEHQQLVGVAPLVVVPGNNLYEGVGQRNTSLLVEDGGASVAKKHKICNFYSI